MRDPLSIINFKKIKGDSQRNSELERIFNEMNFCLSKNYSPIGEIYTNDSQINDCKHFIYTYNQYIKKYKEVHIFTL